MSAARIPFILIIFTVLLVFSALASAQDFDKGLQAYDRGDYAAALREWRPLAEQGNPVAQYSLGVLYIHGQGVPQNYAEAVRWYRMAAEQGYADALNNLGVMYFRGHGVLQDYVLAHKWFNLAAAHGATEGDAVARNRDIVASRMTPAQISEAQKLAREWSEPRLR